MYLGVRNGKTIDFDFAEQIVKSNLTERGNRKILFDGLTTSKLRNLLDLVNNIYSVVANNPEKELSEDVKDKIAYLKIKFAYEVGRDKPVKRFVEQTYVKDLIDDVLKNGSKKQFLDYCKYFEALVAYSKYYGMGDK